MIKLMIVVLVSMVLALLANFWVVHHNWADSQRLFLSFEHLYKKGIKVDVQVSERNAFWPRWSSISEADFSNSGLSADEIIERLKPIEVPIKRVVVSAGTISELDALRIERCVNVLSCFRLIDD